MWGPIGCTRVLSLVVAASLAAGCYSTSVRVVQRVPNDHPRDHIYVIVYEGGAPASYGIQLARAVIDALGVHVSERRGRVLTGIEFDTSFVDQEIDRFGAQAVLAIKPIGTRTGRYGEILALIYAATLTEHPSNKPLWAAEIGISGAAWPEAFPDAAAKLVGTLADEHLIPPPLPRVPTPDPLPVPPPQTGEALH
jgi:hypothetical protein